MTIKMRVHGHGLMGGPDPDRKISITMQVEPGQEVEGGAFSFQVPRAQASEFPVGAKVNVILTVE